MLEPPDQSGKSESHHEHFESPDKYPVHCHASCAHAPRNPAQMQLRLDRHYKSSQRHGFADCYCQYPDVTRCRSHQWLADGHFQKSDKPVGHAECLMRQYANHGYWSMPDPVPVTGAGQQRILYNPVLLQKYLKHWYNCLGYLPLQRALGHACFDMQSKQARGQIPQCYDL